MAKITLDLNRFKASGIYTVEFDASESITISTQTIRLVVGFSRKGPFNAPVFLRDLKTARKIFGDVDYTLEKKGSFFHRSIETCLQTGPIFALNLLPLNNTPTGDKVDYRSFSLSIAEDNGETTRELLSSFYNKERFWFADSEYFQAIVNNDSLNKEMLMSFTNLGQRPVSIITRKAKNIKGFDITARDFYGAGNVPEYIKEFDYISDYFIDVIVVEGNWTNYQNLSIDPQFSRYFTKAGIKSDMLEKFIADDNITLVANITGCIIPDFIDKNGTNQFIETIINNNTATTGIFMTMNKNVFDDYTNSIHKIDLIGHSLIDTTKSSMNFLSYVSPITDELYFSSHNSLTDELEFKEYNDNDFNNNTIYVKSLPYINNSSSFFNTIVIPKPRPTFTSQTFGLTDYAYLYSQLSQNSLIAANGTDINKNEFVKVDEVINTGTSIEIVVSNPDKNKTIAGIYNNATISLANETDNSCTITFTGDNVPANLKQFDCVYVNGYNKYFVIESAIAVGTPTGGEWDVTFYKQLSDIPSIYNQNLFYTKWLPSIENGMKFKASEINNKTASYCDAEIALSYIPNILDINPSGTNKMFKYIVNPSFINDNIEDHTIDVYPGNKLYTEVVNKSIIDGDYVSLTNEFNLFNYLSFDKEVGLYGLNIQRIKQWKNSELTIPATQFITAGNVGGTATYTKNEIQTVWSSDPEDPWMKIANEYDLVTSMGAKYIALESSASSIEANIPIVDGYTNVSKTTFRIDADHAQEIEVGQFLVVDDDLNPRLTRVIKKIKKTDINTGYTQYEIVVNEPIKIIQKSGINYIIRFLPIPQIADTLQFTNLSGFTITSYHTPGTPEQLEKIYGVIENTNLGDTLVDKELISFRYIVDTMAGGLAPMSGPKSILSRLAKRRMKCMALINAPSIAEFIASTDPRFTDEPRPEIGEPKPILKPEYIASGGNLSLGPSFRYSLPDDENGAKFCGVFSPFLKIREQNKTKNIPPAADVSNNFIRKFINGQPYAIAAGPHRGVISNAKLVGLEYEYLITDREYIEPFGLNPIITTKKTGPMIYGNQTAYQKTLTAFNNLHVRDLLITIEEAIEDVLANYVFEYNDARTRLEIRTIVDGYLQTVKNSGGIYDYMVIMDENNNTNEIIDQNIGIIDVGIEPAKGLQKVINRVTVLKTGSISSGGFTVA